MTVWTGAENSVTYNSDDPPDRLREEAAKADRIAAGMESEAARFRWLAERLRCLADDPKPRNGFGSVPP